MTRKILIAIFLILFTTSFQPLVSQVKISDNNNTTIDANAILDLESDSLGLLPPTVVLTDINSPFPLTAPVTKGMLVYSSGGAVNDGYYFWDGSKWVGILGTGADILSTVVVTADATLSKDDNFVLASNDITLTLPLITAADNGLQISIKNNGNYLDQVVVQGSGGATIDNVVSSTLTRYKGQNFVAYNGNWYIKNKDVRADNLLDVTERGSWTTIDQVVEYLNAHMSGPTVVRLGGGTYTISETQVIDLPYPVTFQGLSYGETIIEAESAFTGGLFSCATEAYFKMISFQSAYGSTSGHNAINLTGSQEYYEIKDIDFTGFNKGINITNNIEVWIFDADFTDCTVSGIEVAAGSANGTILKVSEADFFACGNGINLVSSVNATVSILNCTFYCSLSSDIGVNYVPATFTNFSSIFITNNSWNNIGKFFNGFDFSLSSGRDANAYVQNNLGTENKNPHCKIIVLNNATATPSVTTTWKKANWANQTSYTAKWTIETNRITYQPNNKLDVVIWISGNIIDATTANRVINVGIVKNGNSSIRYGETSIRITTTGQPYQWSTVAYMEDILPGDYFELWCNLNTSGTDNITFQDLNWFTNSQ